MAADELTKMIDTLVETKTFGLDAIDGVKALRDKAADLEKKLIAAGVAAANTSEAVAKQNAAINQQLATIAAWEKREAELRAREAKMTELEKSVAVESAKSFVWDTCFSRLFANRVVRESTTSNIPTSYCPPGSSYPVTQWNTETKGVTREEG
jgi:hypothetical protein